ncbi:MAG TPA: pectinesterase family protein [Asticcacaulis sp.]|nr:pectinesterase family protein [Asticcacaulis sp.]
MLTRRSALTGLAIAPLFASTVARAAEKYDARLSVDGKSKDSVPAFATLAEAIAAAPADGSKPYRILIPAGDWRMRALVDKPNVHLIGEGTDKSRIVFNNKQGDEQPDPFKPYGCSTVVVIAPGFAAKDLHLDNDYDWVGAPIGPRTGQNGSSGRQADALRLAKGSDKAYFENVRMTAWQDTLWTDQGRSLFRNCEITGCVDFIYGAGQAVFEKCTIVSRVGRVGGEDGKPETPGLKSFITAPSTQKTDVYGLVFFDCRLTKEPGVAVGSVALGRPWKPTKPTADGGRHYDVDAVGQAVFLRCWMDDHVTREAWTEMGGKVNDTVEMIQPEVARFFEYKSSGPGAGPASTRRRLLSDADAAAFTPEKVLAGWDIAKLSV